MRPLTRPSAIKKHRSNYTGKICELDEDERGILREKNYDFTVKKYKIRTKTNNNKSKRTHRFSYA